MSQSKDPKGNREASDRDAPAVDLGPALQEGVDYYLENGLMVFTAAFLQKRGYCCERGCRHCPYGYQNSKG
ncbi:MAG: DUF5522 domain-containing protein [Pyrinomonadaceae bacterium]